MSNDQTNMRPVRIGIRRPTAGFQATKSAETFAFAGPIAGSRFGIRTDPSWTSWLRIADDWAARLRNEGAEASLLPVLEHSGEGGRQKVRALDDLAKSTDACVVGIGT
jgi:hypothetical protein